MSGSPASRRAHGTDEPQGWRGRVPGAKAPTGQRRASAGGTLKVITPASRDYELPIVHLRVPDTAVQVAFWGGLTGAVVLGAVDVPLAAWSDWASSSLGTDGPDTTRPSPLLLDPPTAGGPRTPMTRAKFITCPLSLRVNAPVGLPGFSTISPGTRDVPGLEAARGSVPRSPTTRAAGDRSTARHHAPVRMVPRPGPGQRLGRPVRSPQRNGVDQSASRDRRPTGTGRR